MTKEAALLVSIILPAYNSSSFISTTVESIKAQDYQFWELIIVDDGSTDDTVRIVSAMSDPRIHLVSQVNGGIAAARNTGIMHSKGKLIAFIDHDDYWHPHKLSSQLRVLERQAEVGVVYGGFLRWDPSQPPAFPDANIDISLIDDIHSGWIYHALLQTNWVLFSTAIFRREVFDRIGLFDISTPPADDWDMAIRTSWHFQFIRLKQPLALYRIHAHQTSKRAVRKNHEAEFRERIIQTYGLVGPDGSQADPNDLNLRQFKAHLNHGILHLQSNNYDTARQSLLKALGIKPFSVKAWLYWLLTFRSNISRKST